MVELRLFLAVTLQALQRHPERHQLWFQFMTSVLPYLDRTLPTYCIHVVDQLCNNLEECVTASYAHMISSENVLSPDDSVYGSAYHMQLQKRPSLIAQSGSVYPSNYALNVLESLTTIMHYCILDSFASNTLVFGNSVTSNTAPMNFQSPTSLQTSSSSGVSSMAGSAISIIPGTKAAGELITNIFGKVFTSSDSGSSNIPLTKYDPKSSLDIWRQAREELLKNLSNALATICDVWAIISAPGAQPKLPVGSPEQLKQLILDLLSPIAKRHPNALVHAFSLVWLTRAKNNLSARSEPDQVGRVNLLI
uniref:DOP1-like TPR domain-containing protein n=1 Tax=Acrobeloides nanus TaxID=290746 RepID=A0A914EC48_9BILA